MRSKKRYFLLLFLPIAFLIFCFFALTPTHAEGTGILRFVPWYSDDVAIESGDEFVVTFQNKNSGESMSVTIEPDSDEPVVELEVDSGVYTVTALSYDGSNDLIIEQGYGIEGSVKVPEDDVGVFHIYVGSAQTSTLSIDYGSNAFIIDRYHDENGQQTVYYDEFGAYIYVTGDDGYDYIEYIETYDVDDDEDETEEEDGNSGTSSENEEDWASEIPSQEDTGQEVVVEYYEIENDESSGNGFSSGSIIVIVLFIGIIFGGILFYLRKKGVI